MSDLELGMVNQAPPTTWPEAFEVVGIWFACALIVWAIAWWARSR